MDRYPYLSALAVFFLVALTALPLCAQTDEDPCGDQGIYVRNATMIDLWYKKNGGDCSIWMHEHLFTLRPEDSINLFSDMKCETLYCSHNPKYKEYKSFDADGNCRVRVLPDCTLSDM